MSAEDFAKRFGKMEEDILRLKAWMILLGAERSALAWLARERLAPEEQKVFDARFVASRRRLVHEQLENLESKDPALAAQLSEIIDRTPFEYPLDYD